MMASIKELFYLWYHLLKDHIRWYSSMSINIYSFSIVTKLLVSLVQRYLFKHCLHILHHLDSFLLVLVEFDTKLYSMSLFYIKVFPTVSHIMQKTCHFQCLITTFSKYTDSL